MLNHLRKALLFGSALGVWLAAHPARATDLADEADVEFSLGAEAYKKGDLTSALEHFLASNRLAPNRNVLYNIARVYEALKRFPDAYRYYTQALEGETNPESERTIAAALRQLAGSVAVLRVETSPPGATLYLERKDLGARGTTPRTLGLAPGRYRVFAELPGYEPGETVVEDAKVGEERRVTLELKPILGTLAVNGPAGAELHLGGADATALCRLPCAVDVPPGSFSAFATRPGFHSAELRVTVQPSKRTSVDVELEPLTGTLVVSTDEPRALIDVDGKPRGFTPAILTVPVGHHRVTLSLTGFRTVTREIDLSAASERRLDVSLTTSEEVVAASRVRETVEDAPGSVSVVPRQELGALAYPTLAEAVRGVPGVYVWDDRSYVTVGVRGLGRLGSYGNRIVVLYDGQPVNDDWIGSSYVGYDALSDLGDVQRVEVVRGPGSVLYGTNAFSGVINVVNDQRRPPGVSFGLGTNQNGVARARARGDASFGRNAGAWLTVGGARSDGRSFAFPELGAVAENADGFQSGGLRGGAYYRFVTASWSLNTHDKRMPSGAYETLVGDRRNRQIDTRAFVELKAEPKLSNTVESLTRLHANVYRFRGTYARDPVDGGVEIDRFRGTWFGLEQRVTLTPLKAVRLTAGGELQLHVEVKQTAGDGGGSFLDDSHPFQVGAGYLNADVDVAPSARVSAGARLDAYSTFGSSINPRGAVILRPYEGGNLKILGGRAFRAPSVYELYYNDGGFTQVASPDIRPEVVYSAEIEHSHRFSPTVVGTLAGYGNFVHDLILTEGAGDSLDPLHYRNSRTLLATVGVELGLRREWRQGWMVGVSYSLSEARFLASRSFSDIVTLARSPAERHVANAPAHLATLKGAVPIVSRALLASTRLTVEGPRYDRYEAKGDPAQRHTSPVALWDFVLSGDERTTGVHYALGVYNAFDWRYSLPVSGEFAQRTMPQDGRTFLAQVDVAF